MMLQECVALSMVLMLMVSVVSELAVPKQQQVNTAQASSDGNTGSSSFTGFDFSITRSLRFEA